MAHMQFKKVGKNARIYPLTKILNPEVVSIGDNVIIDDFVLIMGGARHSNRQLRTYCMFLQYCWRG